MNKQFILETEPLELDLESQDLGRSGRWIRRGRTVVVLPGKGTLSDASEVYEFPIPGIPSRKDLIDERIDYYAQEALYRMFKGDPGAQEDARGLFDAVKADQLAGIYIVNQKVPALRAQKMKLGWWQLIPQGEDAILLLDPVNPLAGPPLIAFRDPVKSDPSRLDAALRKAWKASQLLRAGQLRPCESQPGVLTAEVTSNQAPVSNVVPRGFCLAPEKPGITQVGFTPLTSAEMSRRLSIVISKNTPFNQDNPRRTAFYFNYWQRHPEIPWALLAHLVSRNAGYQMSDLLRYQEYQNLSLFFVPEIVSTSIPVSVLLSQLFRFLEAGNFLIFNDAMPQLMAYEVAKQLFKETSDPASANVFNLLSGPPFGVDKTIINEWIRFFGDALKADFWKGVPAPELGNSVIARHTHALVCNEQNYIEDRLLNPLAGTPNYLEVPSSLHLQDLLNAFFKIIGPLRLTRLIFARSGAGQPGTPSQFMLHTVGDFSDLGRRIDTGRKLYFGVFLADPGRTEGIKRWAASILHDGSRVRYDDAHYSFSSVPDLLFSSFKISSLLLPPGSQPRWPGPPPPSLPTWSTLPGRISIFTRALAGLTVDPFAPPEGEILVARATRPLHEILF